MGPRRWFPDAITGERVVLRRHVEGNIRAFQRWYADPDVVRLTRYQDGPMRRDEIERFFAARALGVDSLAMAIHLRDGDRLIGTCALSQLDRDNGSALFHITIGEKDMWGAGYGTEATRLMIGHAFEGLGLHRVALTVFAFNERAVRSYRSVGFLVEGRAREAIWREGRWWDEISMSILDSDWTAMHPRPVSLRPAADATVDGANGAGDAAAPERRGTRRTGAVAGFLGRRR